MDHKAPPHQYVAGVMLTPLAKPDPAFQAATETAVERLEADLKKWSLELKIELFSFVGPHLTPQAGRYSPLDFLQIAVTERVERRPDFLLVVTEVDLATRARSYAIALPSPITNVGIVSTKRLDPRFWGEDPMDHVDVTTRRLVPLLWHTFGHLLGLNHSLDSSNIMYDFERVEELESMTVLSEEQIDFVRRRLPEGALELTGQGNLSFVVGRLAANVRRIFRYVARANPFALPLRLPTLLAAGLSLIVVVFFSSESWDFASSASLVEIGILSFLALMVATVVLHDTDALQTVSLRSSQLAESVLITKATTTLTVFLTLVVLYSVFFVLTLLAIVLVFPDILMETWPTSGQAVTGLDHIKLGMFSAALGMLGGSLGGRTENRALMRAILFSEEET